jgi:hypothetical protein
MKKVIRLTEADLVKLVKRVINEQSIFIPGTVSGGINVPLGDSKNKTTSGSGIPKLDPAIVDCATRLGLKTILEYPDTSMTLAKVFSGSRLPTKEELDAVEAEISKKGFPTNKLMELFTCVLTKKMTSMF